MYVYLLHAGIVSKRLNVGSHKQRHMIAQGHKFSHVAWAWGSVARSIGVSRYTCWKNAVLRTSIL